MSMQPNPAGIWNLRHPTQHEIWLRMTQIRQLVLSIGAKSKPIWDVEMKEVKPMPTVVSLVQSNHFPITTIPTSRVGCLLFCSSPLFSFFSCCSSSIRFAREFGVLGVPRRLAVSKGTFRRLTPNSDRFFCRVEQFRLSRLTPNFSKQNLIEPAQSVLKENAGSRTDFRTTFPRRYF